MTSPDHSGPGYPGFLTVVTLERCGSTNNYVKEHFHRWRDRLPVLVTSAEQTAGRGRRDRAWASPPGQGLYSSFGFSWEETEKLRFLSLLAGTVVIDTLEHISGRRLTLKWPNDVVCKEGEQHRKIAGILVENIIAENAIFSVVGIGINLNQLPGDFPVDLRATAASLRMVAGPPGPPPGPFPYHPRTVNPLLADLFFKRLEQLRHRDDGAGRIVALASRYSADFTGRTISFHHPAREEIVKGTFRGIHHDGGLILEDNTGRTSIHYSGEIS